ncbi:MAG: amidophosphoribosyltransferase [Rhodospirillaceae bacterium]|nr:amidophosphoribosyltransferase [Rhodospirillaceae bacterium]
MTLFLPRHPFDDDRLHEECGVFGIFGTKDAAAHTALGLHALQHRGQESAGIVAYDSNQFHVHRSLGLVSDVFASEAVMDRLAGHAAIGHNRYATTGGTVLRNVQPIFVETDMGGLALAHNGNLTNAHQVKQDLVKHGAIFQSTADTEIIVHLVALSTMTDMPSRLVDALKQVVGAYSLVALTETQMIGVRDPLGVRPLVLGELDGDYVLTSETCALDIIGATFIRDIEPGEMVIVDSDGLHSMHPFPKDQKRFCVFEYIYFSRPDSQVEGRNAYEVRKRMGAELARESGVPADVVVPVPDSGVPAALGYAEESSVPFALGIIRNHYVGRTFIQPSQHIRHLGVKLKHNANRGELAGKRVMLLDDSIVRGTTSTKIVAMVRDAGATEVHMRIASPPTTHSCFYGVDTPSREELLASRMDVADMAEFIGVDSLAFLTVDGLYRAAGQDDGRNGDQPQYCDACLTGDYPINLVDRDGGFGARQLSLLDDPS